MHTPPIVGMVSTVGGDLLRKTLMSKIIENAVVEVPSTIPPNHRSVAVRLAPSDTVSDDPRGPFDAVWVTSPGSMIAVAGDEQAVCVLRHCDVSESPVLHNVSRLYATGTTAEVWGRPSIVTKGA